MPVIGICNGFQVLTEAGLLPGALMRNAGLSFVCRPVSLKVENSQSLFTSAYDAGEAVSFPVAHHDGNYQADAATLDRLEGEGRVAFRYLEEVNGSARRIAGILNDAGNVLGLMPHPERAVEPAHGVHRRQTAVRRAAGDRVLAAGLGGDVGAAAGRRRRHAQQHAVGARRVDHLDVAVQCHRLDEDDHGRRLRGGGRAEQRESENGPNQEHHIPLLYAFRRGD